MNPIDRLVTDPGPVDETWDHAPVPRGRHAAPMTLERKLLERAEFYRVVPVEFRGRHARRLAVAS